MIRIYKICNKKIIALEHMNLILGLCLTRTDKKLGAFIEISNGDKFMNLSPPEISINAPNFLSVKTVSFETPRNLDTSFEFSELSE